MASAQKRLAGLSIDNPSKHAKLDLAGSKAKKHSLTQETSKSFPFARLPPELQDQIIVECLLKPAVHYITVSPAIGAVADEDAEYHCRDPLSVWHQRYKLERILKGSESTMDLATAQRFEVKDKSKTFVVDAAHDLVALKFQGKIRRQGRFSVEFHGPALRVGTPFVKLSNYPNPLTCLCSQRTRSRHSICPYELILWLGKTKKVHTLYLMVLLRPRDLQRPGERELAHLMQYLKAKQRSYSKLEVFHDLKRSWYEMTSADAEQFVMDLEPWEIVSETVNLLGSFSFGLTPEQLGDRTPFTVKVLVAPYLTKIRLAA